MRARAARYARAAVEVAGPDKLDTMAGSLAALAQAIAEVPALREAAFNPAFRGSQAQILGAVVEHLGGDRVAQRLVALMARNRRLREVGEVAESVTALSDARAGRLRARLESAVPLAEGQAARIAAAVGRRLGASVQFTARVRPELIGGWVCHVGAITLDASLRRALDNLAERLLYGARPH